jgi:hypothetical protein
LLEISQDLSEIFFGNLFVSNNVFEFADPFAEERIFFLFVITFGITVKKSGNVLIFLIFEVFLLRLLWRFVSNARSIKRIHDFFVNFVIKGLTRFFGVILLLFFLFGTLRFTFFELLGFQEFLTRRQISIVIVVIDSFVVD